MLCPLWPFFTQKNHSFLIFVFCVRQLVLILTPAVLGRRDGSIRASRKRRSRNKTDDCPLPKPGWATTATATATEEFSQSIQALFSLKGLCVDREPAGFIR